MHRGGTKFSKLKKNLTFSTQIIIFDFVNFKIFDQNSKMTFFLSFLAKTEPSFRGPGLTGRQLKVAGVLRGGKYGKAVAAFLPGLVSALL